MKSNIYALQNILKAALFPLLVVVLLSVEVNTAKAQSVYFADNQSTVDTTTPQANPAASKIWEKPTVPVKDTVDQIIEDPITDSLIPPENGDLILNKDPKWLDQKVVFYNGERNFVESIEYPQSAINNGLEGVVKIFFVVEPDGRASHIRIIQSLDYDCDQAVIKAVHNALFKPGMVGGKPVRVHCVLPVYFGMNS